MSNYENCCCECLQPDVNISKTRGDAYKSQVNITNKDGQTIGQEVVVGVEFRLYDFDNKIEYSQDYEYNADKNRWELEVPTHVTKTWQEKTSKHKCIFKFADGNEKTILQGLFTVKE